VKLFLSIVAGGAVILVAAVGFNFATSRPRRDPPPVPQARERSPIAPPKEPGFRDIVKNPELWREMIDEQQDVEREVEVARGWSDERVARAVQWYVFEVKDSHRAWGNLTVLQSLGTRTRSEVLRILSDPTLRARLGTPTKTDGLPEAPFNRLCKVLVGPAPEAATLLAPFVEDPSSQIRQDAARLLGGIGTEEALTAVRKALRDPDEYVRSSALRGLTEAVKANRVGASERRDLFDAGLRLLAQGENAEEAAHFLLVLDRERARAAFLSDASLSPESKALHHVLSVLNQERVAVPRARLLTLTAGLNKPNLKYPQTYQLHEALRALGRHKVPEDRDVLNGCLSHPDDHVAAGAAAGLLASHDLEDVRQRVRGPRGGKGPTAPQRHCAAVDVLDAEVLNGGFSQYFFNSSGDDWRNALAGLEAMGSKDRLAIAREAVAKFGAAGPAEDRETRMAQLAKIATSDDALFDPLDSRYYKSKEVIAVMVMRYVLKNPDAFR